MTESEYLNDIKILEEDFNKFKQKLGVLYAKSNNPFKIGDIIEDHSGKGKIIKIKYIYKSFNSNLTECVYTCLKLGKHGNPLKGNKKVDIYQSNIK